MSSEKLHNVISKVLGVSPSEITDQSGPETIERWDSFNSLVLVDELESEFKVKFSVAEITDVKNVADIKRHLRNHGITFS